MTSTISGLAIGGSGYQIRDAEESFRQGGHRKTDFLQERDVRGPQRYV